MNKNYKVNRDRLQEILDKYDINKLHSFLLEEIGWQQMLDTTANKRVANCYIYVSPVGYRYCIVTSIGESERVCLRGKLTINQGEEVLDGI